MLRAMDRFLSAWTNLPDLDKTAMQTLMCRRQGLLPAHDRLETDRCAAEGRKTKIAGWGALNGLPDHLDPACPQKTAFRFPPR